MKTISFHSHLSIPFVSAMIKRCNELANSEDEVTLDFSNVLSIKPLAISLLYNSVRQYFKKYEKLYFYEPHNISTKTYLIASGFFGHTTKRKLYRTTFNLTTININFEQKVRLYLDIIKQQIPQLHGDIFFMVNLCMNELITNVKDHSKSTYGCVVCGQAYTKKREIHISISDYGIGFLKSLQTVDSSLVNDITAIEAAVETQITTRKQASGGLGLQNINAGILNVKGIVNYLSFDQNVRLLGVIGMM